MQEKRASIILSKLNDAEQDQSKTFEARKKDSEQQLQLRQK